MAELGAPPKYENAQQLYDKADEYFTWIKGEKDSKGDWVREPEPPTLTGVTLYLGFESRQSFYDYSEKEEFSYALKKIRTRVENKYEQNLHANNPTGSIFALKNMGWKDKTESEISGPGGGAVQNELQIKIIRDKGNRTTPGDTPSESATGTGSGETV